LTYFQIATIIAFVNRELETNIAAPADVWTILTHMRRIQEELARRSGPALRARGLSSTTLFMLAAAQRLAFPSDLARELRLPPPSVSRFLKSLEAEGYLRRETVSEDLRRYRFRLTDRGEEALAAARAASQAALEGMLERLSPAQRAELAHLLATMAEKGNDAHGHRA
jgi:DNA-binding MarR family transcriptional regulator